MGIAPVRPDAVLAGKYRVKKVLGQGGMGVVVAARHLELDQKVAVKFMLERSASQRYCPGRSAEAGAAG